MAPVVEGVGGLVGDVRIHDDDGEESFALVEDLDPQAGWDLAHARVDEFPRLDVAPAEGEADFGNRVEEGENVRDDVHLGDALHDEETAVGAPFAVCVVSVYGAIHVTWFTIKISD